MLASYAAPAGSDTATAASCDPGLCLTPYTNTAPDATDLLTPQTPALSEPGPHPQTLGPTSADCVLRATCVSDGQDSGFAHNQGKGDPSKVVQLAIPNTSGNPGELVATQAEQLRKKLVDTAVGGTPAEEIGGQVGGQVGCPPNLGAQIGGTVGGTVPTQAEQLRKKLDTAGGGTTGGTVGGEIAGQVGCPPNPAAGTTATPELHPLF